MSARRPTAEEGTERPHPRPTIEGRRFTIAGEQFAVLAISKAEPACLEVLTNAEREVCRLILRGHGNAEIAETRGTSANTVKNQIAALFQKLGVDSRAELAALWR